MRIEDIDEAARAKAPHLMEALAGVDLPTPRGWFVLALQYVRPDKVGSLYVAPTTQKEDEYQGRVGLVLALGPDCYDDQARFPSGPWCKPGDWIVWPALEGAAARFRYGKAVLAIINDDRVVLTDVDPVLATQGS